MIESDKIGQQKISFRIGNNKINCSAVQTVSSKIIPVESSLPKHTTLFGKENTELSEII